MRTGCSDAEWLLKRSPVHLPQLTFCPGQSHMFLASDGLGFGLPKRLSELSEKEQAHERLVHTQSQERLVFSH